MKILDEKDKSFDDSVILFSLICSTLGLSCCHMKRHEIYFICILQTLRVPRNFTYELKKICCLLSFSLWNEFKDSYFFLLTVLHRKHSKPSCRVKPFYLFFLPVSFVIFAFPFLLNHYLLMISSSSITDLNLSYPKMMDVAVPANMVCGLHETKSEAC